MLKLRLARHCPCFSLAENLGHKRTRKVRKLSGKPSSPRGRLRKKFYNIHSQFANSVFQFPLWYGGGFRHRFTALLLTVRSFVKTSGIAASEYITTASVVILAMPLRRRELLVSSFIEWKQSDLVICPVS